MKAPPIITIAGLILLSGCAGRETASLDPEFGLAQEAIWQKQIIRPDATEGTPEGVAGIHAEVMMQSHNLSYVNVPVKVEIKKYQIP